MTVGGIEIELVQKRIKNLHLAVYPPDGRVRLAAPTDVNETTLQLYVVSKLSWIRKQQRKFAEQNRQSPRQYLHRESHYFLGKRYLLRVADQSPVRVVPSVTVRTKSYIDMVIPADYTQQQKQDLLQKWYRVELKKIISDLVPRWEATLGVTANTVTIKAMKTKWGSCNPETGNILLNMELAKKPHACIEYVVVHELLHLIERKHSDIFLALLDKYLPNWVSIKKELNSLPV